MDAGLRLGMLIEIGWLLTSCVTLDKSRDLSLISSPEEWKGLV